MMEKYLNKKVSFQSSAISNIVKELTIKEVLGEIQSSKYKLKIEKLRILIRDGDIQRYDIHKKTLPAVTFCGTFEGKRKKEFLKDYNKILIIDIDKLDDSELKKVKEIIQNDVYVFASWESPSKKGIKGLVSLSYVNQINSNNIDELHKYAFTQLSKYFWDKYGIKLDASGSDVTRLCFFSHDQNLQIKNEFEEFRVELEEMKDIFVKSKNEKVKSTRSVKKLDSLYNPKNKNSAFDRKIIQAIIRYLTKRKLSITYSYEEWYRVALAISNTFTYEIGEKYFLSLCKLDTNKYDEQKCKNLLIYSYENTEGYINFDTIIFLAKKKGYLIKNQEKEEVPKTAVMS